MDDVAGQYSDWQDRQDAMDDTTALCSFFKGSVDDIGECFGEAVVDIMALPWKQPLVGIPIRFERRIIHEDT